MLALIASICLGVTCHDVVVTTSEQDPYLNIMTCQAPANVVDWLQREWPGYRLASWKCVIGKRGTAT
jgi:hypothetical protein